MKGEGDAGSGRPDEKSRKFAPRSGVVDAEEMPSRESPKFLKNERVF